MTETLAGYPVVVVAVITPHEGRLPDLLTAFERVAPRVQLEAGCELYAVHSDGEVCVVVERWSSREALSLHSTGEAMRELESLWGDSLSRPFEAWVVENVPLGDPAVGTIP